jgi:UDP-sugar pyrophosphorylase
MAELTTQLLFDILMILRMLGSNVDLLSDEEKALCQMLLQNGQEHLFQHWDPPGTNDHLKHLFFQQIQRLHESYLPSQGGLVAYIRNAQRLLEDSMRGVNPLQGWNPSIPSVGVSIEPISAEYEEYDQIGNSEIDSMGFVLVAGGLGERLGFSGIKIALPTETLSNTCYIDFYCQQILAIQRRSPSTSFIPFAIMVSDDTHQKTIDLFQQNSYFGLHPDQVSFLKQDKVAALLDNSARIALHETNPYEVNCKPHGHGDVHSLLYQSGLAQRWHTSGVKWLFFFQDTNGLALTSVSAMLGVSIKKNLHMNSRAIPRYAKQAIGALVRLTNDSSGAEMTVNVEYNLLDPLLRSTISPDGDTNDPTTGQSIFPGNINQLLIRLEDYLQVLQRSHGVMNEFVNPKYSDDSRTTFKKPTRLECMMQDYSYGLQGSGSDGEAGGVSWNPRVGYTLSPGWSCYSPVKNHVTDAAQAVKKGIPAACALTGEADQYFMWKQLLRKLGCDVTEGPSLTLQGITASLSPQVVFLPSFALFPLDLSSRFPFPSKVKISSRSSLLVEGDVIIEGLSLDGACRIVNRSSSKTLRVRLSDESVVIQNEGYEVVPLSKGEEKDEVTSMRGFCLKRMEELVIELTEERVSSVTLLLEGGKGERQINFQIEEREGEIIYSLTTL